MGERPSRGPETPTLLERIVLLLRLPYPLGAFIFALWLPAARLAFSFAATGTLAEAVDLAFLQPVEAPLWRRVGIQVLGPANVLYALWVVRYMRLKALAAKEELAPLLPGGEEAYRDAVTGLSRAAPPIIIGAMILVPGILLSGPPESVSEVLLFLPPQFVVFLAYGTWGWVYFTALGGVYRLVRKPLRLRRPWEDRMLGTRPLGTFALSMAAAFFILMAMVTAQFPLAPTPDPLPLFLFNLATISAPSVLGAVIFLLPLRAVHRQLVEAKQRERAATRQRVAKAMAFFVGEGTSSEASLEDLQVLVSADLAERRIDAVFNWPVGTRILGRFAVATLTLVAATLARVILYVLQL